MNPLWNDSMSERCCIDCPHHKVIQDPDPHDWFCDDDVAAVCSHPDTPRATPDPTSRYAVDHQDLKAITSSCRPYRVREEAVAPAWCPLRATAEAEDDGTYHIQIQQDSDPGTSQAFKRMAATGRWVWLHYGDPDTPGCIRMVVEMQDGPPIGPDNPEMNFNILACPQRRTDTGKWVNVDLPASVMDRFPYELRILEDLSADSTTPTPPATE